MPKLGPIKKKQLIKYLRGQGFDGPYGGGNHSFMKRGPLKVHVPNTDVGIGLLRRILKQVGISEDEWEKLD